MKINSEENKIVLEEVKHLAKTIESILDAKSENQHKQNFNKELEDLRDFSQKVKEEDLPALYDQYNLLKSRAEIYTEQSYPSIEKPYFAHMKFKLDSGFKDIYLGHNSFFDQKNSINIIDWKNAPLSKIYFNYKVEEEYEEELADKRILKGEILCKRALGIDKRVLSEIRDEEKRFVKNENNEWEVYESELQQILSGGQGSATKGFLGTGLTGKVNSEISGLLDENQFEVLNLPADVPVVIQGSAGSGKTTVAIHRVAMLMFKDQVRFKSNNVIGIVPELGIKTLSQKMLTSLRINEKMMVTFPEWIEREAKRLFGKDKIKLHENSSTEVVRVKRSSEIIDSIDRFIERKKAKFLEKLEKELSDFIGFDSKKISENTKNESLADMIKAVKKEINLLAHKNKIQEERIIDANKFVDEVLVSLSNVFIDLKELYYDIELFYDFSGKQETLKSFIRQAKWQFLEKKESTVDPEQEIGVDGKHIDEDTPWALSGAFDIDDLTILFYLLIKNVGLIKTQFGILKKFEHVYVDEIQEYSALELIVLKNIIRENSAVTIAGDLMQQTGELDVDNNSWEMITKLLAIDNSHSANLKTVYRSTEEISKFSQFVLGDLFKGEQPHTVKKGAAVVETFYKDFDTLAIDLTESLVDLMQREPRATVAVICENEESARTTFASIKTSGYARLNLTGDFKFIEGIEVTYIDKIRGLEFDYVVLPDLSSRNYPNTNYSRRRLHVGATRAIHQLWIMGVEPKSKIVQR